MFDSIIHQARVLDATGACVCVSLKLCAMHCLQDLKCCTTLSMAYGLGFLIFQQALRLLAFGRRVRIELVRCVRQTPMVQADSHQKQPLSNCTPWIHRRSENPKKWLYNGHTWADKPRTPNRKNTKDRTLFGTHSFPKDTKTYQNGNWYWFHFWRGRSNAHLTDTCLCALRACEILISGFAAMLKPVCAWA